jgi:predicted permease
MMFGFGILTGLLVLPLVGAAFILAQRFHAAPEEVSATVLLSTLLAALSFPLTAWLLAQPVGGP